MRAFRVLFGEAVRDGMRGRLALVVGFALVTGLMSAQSCSQVGLGSFSMEGQEIDPRVVAGFVAPLLYASQALTILVIAGFIAADHLARPLAEGSVILWLARPVSRDVWVLSRLAGALAISFAAGVVLLGGTALLLVQRQGVPVMPAVLGAAATALGSVVVAALAMAASLAVGRTAVMLLVMVGITIVAIANGYGMALAIVHPDIGTGGMLGLIDRFGPPLFTSIGAAVGSWNAEVQSNPAVLDTFVRLLFWSAGSIVLLLALFRRRDIES